MSTDTYATGSLLGTGGKKNGRNMFFWVIFVLVTDQLRKNWSCEASLHLILENRKSRKIVMITWDHLLENRKFRNMVMITWDQHSTAFGREDTGRLSRRRAALTGKALRALGGAGHPGLLAQGFGLLSAGTREQPWGLA